MQQVFLFICSQGSSEDADHDSHQQQKSRYSGHHPGGASQRGRQDYGVGFRGGIRGSHMGSIRGGSRLPGTMGGEIRYTLFVSV